jgi:hypothetical protein
MALVTNGPEGDRHMPSKEHAFAIAVIALIVIVGVNLYAGKTWSGA